eukprot:CAMPEP_0204905094 /NCGR_PEP_ID=MMETSP1397-20131031/5238_1 /ASSEMBLY_ACC=CAM_ASM_000891 /TAXON_ID=49980 /ORGANISM="Climacostomum Climacostomum virens, Strain Stock W-24" /LENGTH=50 /DNA_ID=CAMNT_0052073951 /DNA_START=328 /DNA_END=480 /DNA_ORIENTATION=+
MIPLAKANQSSVVYKSAELHAVLELMEADEVEHRFYRHVFKELQLIPGDV